MTNPANKALACIPSLGSCEPSQASGILLADATPGSTCLGLSQSEQGLTDSGHPCQKGTAGCDLREKIAAHLECAPGFTKCGSPTVVIEVQVFEGESLLRAQTYSQPAYPERRFVINQRLPMGQPGGACESGWAARKLNNIVMETADAVQALKVQSGSILLGAGSYDCEISARAFRVGRHQAVLFDVTKRALLLLGSSERSPDSPSSAQTTSRGFGHFELKGNTVVTLFHYCEKEPVDAKVKPQALGAPAGKFPEVYAELNCVVR